MARKYTLKKRAQKQAETRERILDAIVSLHEEIGPAHTSISAIAERAGVQRLTVYRHFPEEPALFEACRDHWMMSQPVPEPGAWRDITDPAERLLHGLLEMYRFFEHGEPMIAHVVRDASINENVANAQQPFLDLYGDIQQTLAAGWEVPSERRTILNAAIAHAIDFSTWQSLARHQGLESAQVAALMVCLVQCAASGDCEV